MFNPPVLADVMWTLGWVNIVLFLWTLVAMAWCKSLQGWLALGLLCLSAFVPIIGPIVVLLKVRSKSKRAESGGESEPELSATEGIIVDSR